MQCEVKTQWTWQEIIDACLGGTPHAGVSVEDFKWFDGAEFCKTPTQWVVSFGDPATAKRENYACAKGKALLTWFDGEIVAADSVEDLVRGKTRGIYDGDEVQVLDCGRRRPMLWQIKHALVDAKKEDGHAG